MDRVGMCEESKQIVFSITTRGCDGKGKESYVYSSFYEKDRDTVMLDMNQHLFFVKEEIVNIEESTTEARRKLTSIDKLLLNIKQEKQNEKRTDNTTSNIITLS